MLKVLITILYLYTARSCTDGFYDLAGSCELCYGSCATCDGPDPDQCLTCIPGTTPDGTKCVCPTKQYFDVATTACAPCETTCGTCEGPASTQCLTCTLPKKFYSGTCVDCPYNSYLNGIGDCTACHHTCNDCSGPALNECISCKNNMELKNGKCVCPLGMFLHASTYTCLPCFASCASCTGPLSSQCLSCPVGLTLQSTACSCPSSNYFDTATLKCLSCHPSCGQCSGPALTQCIGCREGTYLSASKCLTCDTSCLACAGSATDCTKCSSDKVLLNGQCILKKNNGCHETCQQCQGPAQDECVVCNPGLVFIEGGRSGFCAASCPESYYLSNTGYARCVPKTLLKGALSISKELNTYRITFNADISAFYNDILSLMSLQIQYSSKQKAIGFARSYTLVPSNKAISIFLDFDGHLLPSNILLITFNTPAEDRNLKFKLLDSYLQIELQESMEYSSSMQQAIGAASSINSAGSQGNGAFSFSSTFFLKSIHAIRSQIMEKMLSYFIFMNVDFPPNLIQYYQDMLENDDSYLPDMFSSTTARIQEEKENARVATVTSTRRMLASNSLDRETRYNGLIPNQMFLANYGSELTVLFIAICIGVVAEVGVRLMPGKYHSKLPYKGFVYVSRSIIYNFALNELIENYHDMAIYSMVDVLNIADFRAADAFYYLAGLLALIAVLFMPFGFFFLVRWLNKRLKEYNTSNDKDQHKDHDLAERLELLDKPFKSGSLFFFMYNLLLMIRSFGFAIVIVFAAGAPALQVLYIPIVTVPIMFYLLKYKPFKVKAQLYLTLTYEALFSFAALFVLILHFFNVHNIEDGDTRTNLGFVIIACSLAMMGLDFLSMLVEIAEMRKLCKRRKTKKITPMAFAAVPLQSPTPNTASLLNQSPEMKNGNMSTSFNGLKILIDENNDSHQDNSVIDNKNDGKSPSLMSITPQKKSSYLKIHAGSQSQLLSTVLKSKKSAVWPSRESIMFNPISPSASEKDVGDQDKKALISPQYESEKEDPFSNRNTPEKKGFLFAYDSEGAFSTRNELDKKGLLSPSVRSEKDTEAKETDPFSNRTDQGKKDVTSPKAEKEKQK